MQSTSENKSTELGAKIKARLSAAIVLIFLCFGTISLLSSLFLVNSVLAFIGLSLLFWGALLIYIQPQTYIRNDFFTATLVNQVATLNQIVSDLGYKGKPIFLPPNYVNQIDTTKIFIPKEKKVLIPELEQILNEAEGYLKKSQGILLTPPTTQLTKLFEDAMGLKFKKVNLHYLTENLPKFLVEYLALADAIEINVNGKMIHVNIKNSSLVRTSHNSSNEINMLRCPLCNAIACMLAESTRKPITIENLQTLNNETFIKATYKINDNLGTEEPSDFILTSKNSTLYTGPLIKLIALISTILGSIILTIVGWITYSDVTVWGKNITTIFFGSRVGEFISLGLDVKLITFLLIGITLVVIGFSVYFSKKVSKSLNS